MAVLPGQYDAFLKNIHGNGDSIPSLKLTAQ